MLSELRTVGFKAIEDGHDFRLSTLCIQYKDKEYYLSKLKFSKARIIRVFYDSVSSFKKGAPFLATYKQEALYD